MMERSDSESVIDDRGGLGSETNGSPENVVLISIDSLRADHCGFLDSGRNITPTLDRLAENGVVFENAIAPGPRTPSSMPVAFTGRFNEPAAFSGSDWERRYGRISEHLRRHETLPERLQAAGYTTVGVTLNPWTQGTDFDTGFDRFVEVTGNMVMGNGNAPLLSALDTVIDATGAGERVDWDPTKDWLVQWPHYYETILEAVESVSEPYFLWVFSLDPHQPYLAPREYRTDSSLLGMYYANLRESAGDSSQGDVPGSVQERLKRAYRDAVRSADGFVGDLLDGLSGDPAVVVHSDHGEALGEHGHWGHPSELYEEHIRVPLVVSNGERRDRVSTPVSLRCLAELVPAVASGHSFDPASLAREHVLVATEGLEEFALRGRRWKYISRTDTEEVYDLRNDPGETTDLSDEFPEVTNGLRQLLARRRASASEELAIAKAAQELHENYPRERGTPP